jgi:cell migration-inducing and hyaluronan-binding protein
VSTHHRSLLLASLLPAFLIVGVFAVVQAQEGRAPAARPTNWSDAATWPDRRVPRVGDKVTIPAGKAVVLDVSPPALGSLTIDGKLSFADNRDLELTTEWVLVHGELEIGTEARPHTRKATITFTNNVPDEEPMKDMGDRGIMIMGGTLNLHGDRTHISMRLAGGSVTRSSSRPRISTPGRPSGAPLRPYVETRSRSIGTWSTCTSARSPSTWTNAAKSVC